MKIVFATQNLNKLKEIQQQAPKGIEIVGLTEIGCSEELPETGNTLESNAVQKASYVFENYGIACFADDTGLEIDALNGEPGVYSARYAGEDKNAELNMEKVLRNLEKQKNRRARFRTVIAYATSSGCQIVDGVVNGSITHEKIGNGGFGYDPIFIPDGETRTFGEMTMNEKAQLSHRARAFSKFIDLLKTL